MESWLYIFSQFTSEALLFELLIIFLIFCAYLAFWILRKRRYGSVDANLPSGPVKSYLNDLIAQTELLRNQLFGLFSSTDASRAPYSQVTLPTSLQPASNASTQAGAAASPLSTNDPQLAQKLAALEAQLAEQTRSIEGLTAQKTTAENELAQARSAAGSGTVASGGRGDNSAEMKALQQKLSELEGKLAEYNVIEDDLANLKRLQLENAQLKASLAEKGSAPAETPAVTAASTPTPEPEPTLEATPEAAEPAAAPAPEPEPLPPILTVEGTSVIPPTPAAPEPTAEIPEETPSAPQEEAAPDTPEPEKSEADLVAEFEKMLKG